MKCLFLTDSRVNGLTFFLVATVLFGCRSMTYPDVNVDSTKNNKATFQRDAIDCALSYPESGSGMHVKQRIGCMNLKGWR
jgi:hypothetical protein